MHVVATAGHVDHGKSTLVRALTGMEPDRWAEERRRGMTIDLGYAWTSLPSGAVLGFVDVPGHQRFIGNMLAGLGPSPAVLVVVAADEGWRQQSTEHLAAVDALGLTHGLLAVTRSDLADPKPAIAEALKRIAVTSLGDVEAVAVSGTTGAGLDDLRAALDRLVTRLPPPDPAARIRLWVDRSFTIRGSGTVVTGTLGAGTLRLGDELQLRDRTVRVRGLQSLGTAYDEVSAAARVAVNLRGVDRDEVARGDALLTPGAWHMTQLVDVRLSDAGVPTELVLHIGAAGVPVRVRPLGQDLARLTLSRPLPLQSGDRGVLRDPGGHRVAAGVTVLDADPPELRRRGAAAARAAVLSEADGTADLRTEVARRGAVRRADLAALGVVAHPHEDIRAEGDWLIDAAQWERWLTEVVAVTDRHAAAHPLEQGIPAEEARQALGLPDLRLLAPVVASSGLEQAAGRIRRPGAVPQLGDNVERLVQRLTEDPFAAPEQPDLDALGLGRREIAAAVAAGLLVRLADEVLLLPDAAALAMRTLSSLPQPFTASAARQALGTTRRVAIPLLEHLDARGWTRRLDGSLREVVR
ncbi:MAG: selenocysteine-specific elongation factor [Actinomycetota bacterium]|nr:selenocysteine-specific elongation factor [Actinomycetota bacterium]